MSMSVLPERVSVHHVRTVPTEPEEAVRSLGTQVSDARELLCLC